MPNHVTHRVLIEGPADRVAQFRQTFGKDEVTVHDNGTEEISPAFDFNTIIEMPAILRDTESSSEVSIGLAMLGVTLPASSAPYSLRGAAVLESMLAERWAKDLNIASVDELRLHLMVRYPDATAKAKQAIECYRRHGAIDWYDWALANWGTKWNAYSVEWTELSDTSLQLTFDTAWSVPEPVFEELAQRDEVKELTITIHAFDEGGGFAFEGVMDHGEYTGEVLEPSNELYEKVYGYPPQYDDEDESAA